MTRSAAGLASVGAGSNQALTLTSAPQDDTNPVWSPDGSRIAFLRRTGEETLQAIVVPSGGGPEQVVASLPGSRPGARKFLTWAPDGEALVGALRLEGSFAIRLYRFPLSRGAAQPVTVGPDGAQDVSPAFSPDGRWLAFLRWENGATYTLWVVPQPGGDPKLLVTSPVPISSFAWKADSRTIVYGGGAISTGELRQVTIEGRQTIAPFVLQGASDEIAIAPKGGRLAYVLQNLDANIWRLPLTRHASSRLRRNSCLPPLVRRWIRRSRLMEGPSRSYRIVPATGACGRGTRMAPGCVSSQRKRLLPFHPAWSPDSREIAFDSVASGKGEIWLIRPSGEPPRRLVGMPGGAQVPSWSRDGKRVFFYSNTGGSRQIWEIPATGGTPVQLTRGASFDPAESPDGRYLYHGSNLFPGIWRTPARAPIGGWKPG